MLSRTGVEPLPAVALAFAISAAMIAVPCPARSQTASTTDQPQGSAASAVTRLPFDSPANDLLVDDFDADGRPDIALTSHSGGYSQVFLQSAPRTFTAGPRIDAVGFHPGQLIRLPGETRRLYLMNAEGIGLLRVFEPAENGSLALVSEVAFRSPRHSSVFHWPDWGLGIAVAPYGSAEIDLIKDLQPLTGTLSGVARLPYHPGGISARALAVADLDHDGADEILFGNTLSDAVHVIRQPAIGATPSVEELWRFNAGGRAHEIVPADVDQDGDIDLLVPDATNKLELDRTDINVLLNDGTGHFKAQSIPFSPLPRSAGNMTGINATAFQIERDGYGYLVAAGYEKLVLMRVPAGWSGGSLETHSIAFKGVQAINGAVLKNIDGDGWLDLAMSRAGNQNCGVVLFGPLTKTIDTLAAEGATLDW